MSISDTVGQAAATDPVVGVAVASANTKNALLAGLQSGDPLTGALMGAVSTEAVTDNQLLSSLTGLGQHLDLKT